MQWLNNPWVIGIGGGILSGFFITIFSRFIIGKRENREYLQKLVSANQEVVYAMRPGISEGVVPIVEVVEAVINSTARKYGVDVKDLYSAVQIGEELIKEVMDSTFISSSKKAEFCQKIGELKISKKLELIEKEPLPKELITVYEDKGAAISSYRRRMTTMLSTMTGILTGLMTMLVVFIQTKNLSFLPRIEILLPTAVAIAAIFMSMTIAIFYREAIKRKRTEKIRKFEIDKKLKKDEAIQKSGSMINAS